MSRLGLILVALAATGCLAYHSSRTEKSDARVVAEQERRIVELERQVDSLRTEYAEAVKLVNLLSNRPSGPPPASMPVPSIAAKITAIDRERNVVTLSVGSDDGVRSGLEFTVYSEDRYIGKVVVELVRGAWCRGSSKKELQARPMEVGQEAKTRW